ncbi:MAG: AMP phosphorylase, partial [Candidatus Nanohaloarchaea archaeon]|nr:AMP phosphorylase [Candidatus Nanohaloarchaea archaeon]
MRFDVRKVDMETKAPIVILNEDDAEELGLNPLDRVQIAADGEEVVGIVDITENMVEPGTMGVTDRLSYLGGPVDLSAAPKPESVRHIREKLDDEELDRAALESIVADINENRLNDVELGAYVTGIYTNNLSLAETRHLTEAMTDIGDTMTWADDVIADKHSIGGVAGNRVTPIVIPIVAAAGVRIPKTSSRAITSPAGTADTMEVFCDVEFSLDDIQRIVEETNGCMVWGGSVNLSPVDDKIIRAEHPLSLDPEGQVIASVLSKKKSAGSTHVVIDIPYGEGSKVDNLPDARDIARRFKAVGDHIDMTVECTITTGRKPIGEGIGPVLEARDVLKVLQGNGPEDLKLKSLRLARILLEICGADADPDELLASGAAEEKFREIIDAQGGDPDVSVDDLQPGEHSRKVTADRDGIVAHVSNERISDIGRRAGAPKHHGAGLELHHNVGDMVEAGDPLFTVYAEQAANMDEVETVLEGSEPMRIRSR